MILSGAMMLDYLGSKFECPDAEKAGEFLITAVKNAYVKGNILPFELGGSSGTQEIINNIYKQLELM